MARSCEALYGAKCIVFICVDFFPFAFDGDLPVDSERSSDKGTIVEADVRVCVFAIPKIRRDVGCAAAREKSGRMALAETPERLSSSSRMRTLDDEN